jgi:hypothetical protein
LIVRLLADRVIEDRTIFLFSEEVGDPDIGSPFDAAFGLPTKQYRGAGLNREDCRRRNCHAASAVALFKCFFATVNVMKILPYFMLAQFTAKNLATSLVLLPIAVTANFAGIWMVRNVSTEHFYRITYILMFVLGSVLCWQGTSHLLHVAT